MTTGLIRRPPHGLLFDVPEPRPGTPHGIRFRPEGGSGLDVRQPPAGLVLRAQPLAGDHQHRDAGHLVRQSRAAPVILALDEGVQAPCSDGCLSDTARQFRDLAKEAIDSLGERS